MDTELFELCKQVHEATGWNDPLPAHFNEEGMFVLYGRPKRVIEGTIYIPLYTSDYLLEKLPRSVQYSGGQITLRVEVQWSGGWHAHYGMYDWHSAIGETPLKALLKLVIALDDAGELPR